MLDQGGVAGPLLGIIISRSVGLPDATDDIGNWGEPPGVLAMIVEAVLLVLARHGVDPATRPRRIPLTWFQNR